MSPRSRHAAEMELKKQIAELSPDSDVASQRQYSYDQAGPSRRRSGPSRRSDLHDVTLPLKMIF